MKGVILAGGKGTRLYPLTNVTNKHLLPIYDLPMIYYPINTLVQAGVDEIMVVVGGNYAGDFIRVLKNGSELGIRHLEYAYQDESKTGISDALSYAEDFADGGNIAVILGDNCTDEDISLPVKQFKGWKTGATVFLKQVDDPERFGVPQFGKGNIIKNILEKPKDPPNNWCVTGLYFYDNTVFDKIRQLKPSGRGEYEITDVNNMYAQEGKLHWAEIKGFWSDAGNPESLFKTNAYWAKKKQAHYESLDRNKELIHEATE